MAQIISKNRMSGEQLKNAEHSNIDIIRNPKNGKTFFVCGTKQGYISPKALQRLASSDCKASDFQYAECSTDDGATYVPCLMVKSTDNVVKSL